jgi:PST family polysaccharide transporter
MPPHRRTVDGVTRDGRPNIGGGVVWTTVSFLAGRVVTFAALLVVTRKVSPAEFGIVAAILAYLAILELVSDLGMRATVVYEQDEGITRRVDVAFTMNVVFAVLLAAVGVLLAPLVAAFFGVSGHTWLFRLAALNLLFGGLGNVHDGLLIRELRFRRRTAPLLFRGIVRGAVTIVFALAGFGATALVLGLLAGSLAWTITLWSLASTHPRWCVDLPIARSMLAYGLGATALQGLAMIGSKLDVTIIGRVLGGQALGVYALAYRIPELVIEAVAWNVSSVAFPAMSRSRREDEEHGIAATTLGLLRWQALYGLPAAVGLAVLSQPLVTVLFGPVWSTAAGVLVAIAVAEAISISIFPLGDALRALGRQGHFIALQCIVLPLLVVLMLIAAPYGVVAVAWMRVIDVALFGAGVVGLARRHLAISPAALGRSLGPGALASLGVLAGAGTTRLAWPALTLPALTVQILAGIAGAALALRLTAPEMWRDLAGLAARLRGARRRRAAASAVSA